MQTQYIRFSKNSRFSWTSRSAKTLGITFSNDNASYVTNNIIPKALEFKKCLKQWEHRKLTLIGKVTVIKTFALPKLVFPFTVLPNPPDTLVDDLTKAMFAFIWDNKPDKIKREQMYKSKEDGGLNVPNLKLFVQSIKTSWIKRYIDENNHGKWKLFFDNILSKRGGSLIFDCNVAYSDTYNICGHNQFLNEMLKAWVTLKPKIKNDARKCIIWNNSDIKVNNESLYYKQWHEKGVLYLEHIFDFRINRFYTFDLIQYLYDIPPHDFLRYAQLTKSIPNYIKNNLATSNINIQTEFNSNLIVIKSKKKLSKYLYDSQIKNTHFKPKHMDKWEEMFNQQLDWQQIYKMPYISTIDTSLQVFQFKIINRIIPTNKYLLKCNITSSSLCGLCLHNVETIIHMFWECPVIQELWQALQVFFNSKGINIELNVQNILFGITVSNNNNRNNSIIMLMKYFIFCAKYKEVVPIFSHFERFLQKRIDIEREIAISKNKLNIHLRKWDSFIND